MPGTQLQHFYDEQKNAVLEIGERALDAVSTAASSAGTQVSNAAGKTEKLIRAHPLKALGVAVGSGIFLGAMAMKLFAHKPTLAESVSDRLGL